MYSALKFLQINVFTITTRIYAKEVAVFQILSLHFFLTQKKTLVQASLSTIGITIYL